MQNAAIETHPPRRSHLGFWTQLLDDQRGANLVEYIILVGVVALIAIGGFQIFGGKVWDKSQKQAEAVGHIGD